MAKTLGDFRKILKQHPELSPRFNLYGRDTTIAAINAINREMVETLPDEIKMPEGTVERIEKLEEIVSEDKAKKEKEAEMPDL
jgi:hypothetical protein